MNGDEIRISDADREIAAEQLGEHLMSGRITADEHSERLDAVLAARTNKELAIPFRDLPVPGAPVARPGVFSTPETRSAGAPAPSPPDIWNRLAVISSGFSLIIFFLCGFVFDGWAWAWIAFLIPSAFHAVSRSGRGE